jgi:hypothetical protein
MQKIVVPMSKGNCSRVQKKKERKEKQDSKDSYVKCLYYLRCELEKELVFNPLQIPTIAWSQYLLRCLAIVKNYIWIASELELVQEGARRRYSEHNPAKPFAWLD